ncbi:hypothetical protein TNCV_2794971 [Trichonephila clavipes]|nr:hypothetical protein TNCV_2794971 [Trichonephila clavipes]
MIKRSIPHHQIFITNNSSETTAIQLIRQNDHPITIVSAYRPPRKPISEQDLHRIFRNQGYVLVAGDLNAKNASWSPHTQQKRRRKSYSQILRQHWILSRRPTGTYILPS